MTFKEIIVDKAIERECERHVRSVDETCWISVLHRMTGFGYMEWETAVCFSDPDTKRHITGSPFIVQGDWRTELVDMPREGLMDWYTGKRDKHPTSMDAILDQLRK